MTLYKHALVINRTNLAIITWIELQKRAEGYYKYPIFREKE